MNRIDTLKAAIKGTGIEISGDDSSIKVRCPDPASSSMHGKPADEIRRINLNIQTLIHHLGYTYIHDTLLAPFHLVGRYRRV